VAPDSVAAIEDGLERLLGDAALRRRLAAGALRTARERDWAQVYDRLLADYAEAVAGKRLTRAA
jgi:glycosyltransferase involved in cell wall biosynthesis